jgi:ribA/ribD-fused uncharacterized protein
MTELKENEEMRLFLGENDVLSNFSYCPFYFSPPASFPTTYFRAPVHFRSVEMFYQFHKCIHAKDFALAKLILETPNPKKIKRMSKTIKNFNEADWEPHKIYTIKQALWLKFTQNPYAREALLETREMVIVEANASDRFWGAGRHKYQIKEERKWPGKNMMGRLLMELRAELRKPSWVMVSYPFQWESPQEGEIITIN